MSREAAFYQLTGVREMQREGACIKGTNQIILPSMLVQEESQELT